MRCAKCGTEIKLGSIYCYACGKEAQIVSDDGLLEEELLLELLKEKPIPQKKKENKQIKEKEKKEKPKKVKKKKKLFILGIIFLVLMGSVIFGIVQKNNHSFEHQYAKGERYFNENNYEKSLSYFLNALQLDNSSIETRIQIAKIYLLREESENAIDILLDAIAIDNTEKVVYEMLVELYLKTKDYEALLKLKETTENETIRELFTDFEPAKPKFNLEPGIYAEHIGIQLLSTTEDTIYYTLNGTDPKEYGEKYIETIWMKEQSELLIRAVSCNKYNIFGEEISGKFIVSFKKPALPEVSPDGGVFDNPVPIQIFVPDGASAYYTWDESTPSEGSARYIDPLSMPEGNNILSVLLIDKYGIESEVLKCNYIYMP